MRVLTDDTGGHFSAVLTPTSLWREPGSPQGWGLEGGGGDDQNFPSVIGGFFEIGGFFLNPNLILSILNVLNWGSVAHSQ